MLNWALLSKFEVFEVKPNVLQIKTNLLHFKWRLFVKVKIFFHEREVPYWVGTLWCWGMFIFQGKSELDSNLKYSKAVVFGVVEEEVAWYTGLIRLHSIGGVNA